MANNAHVDVHDTLDGPGKEGMNEGNGGHGFGLNYNASIIIDEDMENNAPGSPLCTCQWKGTFKELIGNHLIECARNDDEPLMLKLEIRTLKKENKKLKEENTSKDIIINKLEQELKEK